MDYSYPSVFRKQEELEEIVGRAMHFDNNGFLQDPHLDIQKKLEDHYGHVIIKIEPTVRGNIIITMEGNGYIQNNPLTKRRLAVIRGDLPYLQATLTTMINEHPYHSPQKILDSCIPSCPPADKLAIRKWMEETYNFQ